VAPVLRSFPSMGGPADFDEQAAPPASGFVNNPGSGDEHNRALLISCRAAACDSCARRTVWPTPLLGAGCRQPISD
jgi:hypothetical protein